jgi:hypothetical protein
MPLLRSCAFFFLDGCYKQVAPTALDRLDAEEQKIPSHNDGASLAASSRAIPYILRS